MFNSLAYRVATGFLGLWLASTSVFAIEKRNGCFTRQDLLARSQGFVQDVKVKEGQAVSHGAVMIELDSRMQAAVLQEAQAAKAFATAQLDLAKDADLRLKKIKDPEAISEQEIASAHIRVLQAQAQVAQANAAVLKADIALDDTKVKAQIGGVVKGLPQVLGLFVQAGTSLGRIEAPASSCP